MIWPNYVTFTRGEEIKYCSFYFLYTYYKFSSLHSIIVKLLTIVDVNNKNIIILFKQWHYFTILLFTSYFYKIIMHV